MNITRKITRMVAALVALLWISACSKPDLSNLPDVSQTISCHSNSELAVPADPAAAGPWPVGVRTLAVSNGNKADLTAEIWYPATPGSESGTTAEIYDMRQFLPDADAALIPDNSGLEQPCNCYRDLPIDFDRGPYPVIVFVHGTAGFRTASLTQMTHWASRGFIVISADNPKIRLKDLKASPLGAVFATQAQDTVQILEAVHGLTGDLADFHNAIDPTRIGLGGHSAGARAVSELGAAPGVRVIVPMGGRGGDISDAYARRVLYIGSELDGVSAYRNTVTGYNNTQLPKRLVGIANTGHLTYTELCSLGAEFGGVIPLVKSYGVEVPQLFLTLGTDGCGEEFLDPQTGWDIINYASTLAYEELLQCNPEIGAGFNDLGERFGDAILEFDEQL